MNLVPVKFNEEVVITTKTLAQVYECDESNIKVNFNSNKDKFIEDKHYYKLQGEELKKFKEYCKVSNLYFVKPNVNTLYLWTKRGALRHCKMLGTDRAWDMFDMLEENYFNTPKVQQPEDELMIMSKAFLIATNKIKEQAEIIEHQDEQLNAIPNLIPLGTVKREQGRNLEDALIRLGYVVYKDARIVEYNHKYLVCGAKQIHVIKDNLHELLYRIRHNINTNGDVVTKSKLFIKKD
jgi:hypothetical protein